MPTPGILRLYFICQYLLLLGLLATFSPYIQDTSTSTWLYSLLNLLTYPLYYLLPSLLFVGLLRLIPTGKGRWLAAKSKLILAVVYLMTTATVLLIYADYMLYELYEYHFDAFVWNLLTTPGGIDSLGATLSTQMSYAISVTTIALLNASLLFASYQLAQRKPHFTPSRPKFIVWVSLTLLLLVGGELAYAYNHFMRHDAIPQAASVIPFHMHTTSKSTFYKLGFNKPDENEVRVAYGELKYPLQKIEHQRPEKPLNIVWLVAESLRWDMLDPEIMPNLYAFSNQAMRFEQHHSGGNRTRMGMFSMFYGLYAPYWYAFQSQRVGPVLIDVLREQDYQFSVHTSQSFSYPELRDTIFANVPKEALREISSGAPSWKRDEQNINEIVQFINKRDKNRPFFNFMFFEASHAPYDFSDQDEIRKPYLQDMNYARLSNVKNPGLVKNRYINASHSIDRQIGRLLNSLRENDLLDSTIVLFTGDHGEEFMENGNWGHGHNAKFPEEQIHVPLVLHIPGAGTQVVTKSTSHLDIPATIMPLLGVGTAVKEYSQGGDLINQPKTEFVVGNYNYAGIISPEYKIVFPFRDADYFHYSVFDHNDNILPKNTRQKVIRDSSDSIEDFSKSTSQFLQD